MWIRLGCPRAPRLIWVLGPRHGPGDMMIDGVSRGDGVWPLVLSPAVQQGCWRTVPTRELATRASAMGGQSAGTAAVPMPVVWNGSGGREGGVAELPQPVMATPGQLTRHRQRRPEPGSAAAACGLPPDACPAGR